MFATLARAVVRPASVGLMRRAVTAAAPKTTTTSTVVAASRVRCASSLSKIIKAELEEEALVAIDEGQFQL